MVSGGIRWSRNVKWLLEISRVCVIFIKFLLSSAYNYVTVLVLFQFVCLPSCVDGWRTASGIYSMHSANC